MIDDVTTCIDIDECAKNNGGCEHDCLNKPGTFQCKYLHQGIKDFLDIKVL